MVLAQSSRSLDGVERSIANKDLQVLAPLSVTIASGLFVAEEVNDMVLPQIGMSGEPSTYGELSVAFVLDMLTAVMLVAVGQRSGYAGLTAGVATGAIAHSGMNAIDLVQKGLGEANLLNFSPGSSSSTSGTRTTRSRSSRSRSRSRGSAPSNKSTMSSNKASTPQSRRREQNTWG